MTNDSQHASVCSLYVHPLERRQIAGETLGTTPIDYDVLALVEDATARPEADAT